MADAPLESVQDAARAAECCRVGFRVRNLRKKVALGLFSLELTSVPVSAETGGPNETRFERMKKRKMCYSELRG